MIGDLENLSRREREKLLRKREMIMAARAIFARKGYADTKLEDVAELAEFGKGTLYNYFPNKEALFASVLEETFRGFRTIFDETLNSDLDFSEKIRQVMERSIRYAMENAEGLLLIVRESHQLRRTNPIMQLQPFLITQLAESIEQEQRVNPKIMRTEPRLLALVIFNLVIGQFMGRLHSCIHAVRDNSGESDEPKSLADDLFGALQKENRDNIEEVVRSSADLIHTIFFRGIYSEKQ